jgi:hypothetical protein
MRATGHRITCGERINGERSRGLGALGEFVERLRERLDRPTSIRALALFEGLNQLV